MENFFTQYGHWIIALWPVLAAIAAVTPNTYDNKALQIIRNILDALSFNWGSAKNENKKS